MKLTNCISFILSILLVISYSCDKPDYGEQTMQNEGLLNFTVQIPGQAARYSATLKGPYNDGDTIYIKVPTTEQNPLDIAKLKGYASLENNAYADPAIPGLIDFTVPYKITVKSGSGVVRTNYIKVIPTPPKTIFKKHWFKNGSELLWGFSNIPSISVSKDYLFVHDGFADEPSSSIKVYNRMTAELLKQIPVPRTFTLQVRADEEGHFIVVRTNAYEAGFMVYYYEDYNSTPKLLLDYTHAEGCPVNLGNKVSIKGNLKTGKAYLYATATDDMNVYYWELQDGNILTHTPLSFRYGNAGSNWSYATVKRKDMTPNSEHYISYTKYDLSDATELEKGSRFDQFTLDMNVVQMNRKNHLYKIFDYDIFTINGDEFLAMETQPFWAWDGTYLKVFEITDRTKWNMIPTDDGYENFMLMESEMFGGINYNRWGDVAVYVEGNEAYIYTVSAATEFSAAGILMYQMSYFPQ